jgi:protein SCO1
VLNRLTYPQVNRASRVMLIAGLLIVGYLLGSRLNTLLPSSALPSAGDSQRPTGAALVEPPRELPDFTLTSHTGDPIRLSDFRGQAVLLFFGYTHCPDVCTTTLADYRRVKQALGEDANAVQFVFISVDGARDTPDVLEQYLDQFDTTFIGMTGDEATLQRMGAEYGLLFQEESVSVGHHENSAENRHGDHVDDENYFVQHTSPSFLVDSDGYLQSVYFYGTEPEVIAQGIREILQ